ncbi:hypothetical protein Cgig2_025072 [Carnegiea gigantea]|uniref:Protein Ycf2 n=1 Tax=Carnegiea gigantea TaxID=171969 RepID=A0A9Q1Q5M8_9CARY|nr:hypothetical protein Cgig2_025072 [Carnegiea gigantea]
MNYEFNISCLAERRVVIAHYQTITYSQTSCGANSFYFPSHEKSFSLRSDLSPSRGILVMGSIGIRRSCLVKYLVTNSYVPFITVFLRKFLGEKKTKIFFEYDSDDEMDDVENGPRTSEGDDELDDIVTIMDLRYLAMDRDVDHILFEMGKRKDPFYNLFQFKLVKIMSHCIIWIPNIYNLHMNKSNDLSRNLLMKYISINCERLSTSLVIASTNTPQKVDPSLIALNRLNTCMKMQRLLIP